jgi:hypothetical protein
MQALKRTLEEYMSVEPIQTVRSSVIFGGTIQSLTLYEDHVVIHTPRQPGPDIVELRYQQIADLYLHTGVFYATLTLSTGGGFGWMIRWLPKGQAMRAAARIRERIRRPP